VGRLQRKIDIELAVWHSQCWCRESLRTDSSWVSVQDNPHVVDCIVRCLDYTHQPNIIVTSLDLKFLLVVDGIVIY
jgi:hypothetical protein